MTRPRSLDPARKSFHRKHPCAVRTHEHQHPPDEGAVARHEQVRSELTNKTNHGPFDEPTSVLSRDTQVVSRSKKGSAW
jgi:hypothetical protein